jgi:hypothetical protein
MRVRVVVSSLLLLCRTSSPARINAPVALSVNASNTEGEISAGAYVGIPIPIPEFIYEKIPDKLLEPFFPIDFCTEEGRDMSPPITTTV